MKKSTRGGVSGAGREGYQKENKAMKSKIFKKERMRNRGGKM